MGHCGLRAGDIRFAGKQVSGTPPHRRVSLASGWCRRSAKFSRH